MDAVRLTPTQHHSHMALVGQRKSGTMMMVGFTIHGLFLMSVISYRWPKFRDGTIYALLIGLLTKTLKVLVRASGQQILVKGIKFRAGAAWRLTSIIYKLALCSLVHLVRRFSNQTFSSSDSSDNRACAGRVLGMCWVCAGRALGVCWEVWG